ncbi:MAG: cytochrome c [Rhizobiaceae bacterium]
MANDGCQRLGIFVPLLVSACVFALATFSVSANEHSAQIMTRPNGQDIWNPRWLNHSVWDKNQDKGVLSKRKARHLSFMRQGVPVEYKGARNPLSALPTTIIEGRALYDNNCKSCHGSNGNGEGMLANDLSPSPALLSFMISMPMSVDEYLLWSISEGGIVFGSEMPAFASELAREEIWKIVVFMRAGFPQ